MQSFLLFDASADAAKRIYLAFEQRRVRWDRKVEKRAGHKRARCRHSAFSRDDETSIRSIRTQIECESPARSGRVCPECEHAFALVTTEGPL